MNFSKETNKAIEEIMKELVYWYCFEQEEYFEIKEQVKDMFDKRFWGVNCTTLDFELNITDIWNGSAEEFGYLPEEAQKEITAKAKEEYISGEAYFENLVEEYKYDIYNEYYQDKADKYILEYAYEYLSELCEEDDEYSAEDFEITI